MMRCVLLRCPAPLERGILGVDLGFLLEGEDGEGGAVG